MIATVKGLGPAKVTTLGDAFSKPFIIGGLKRTDKTDLSGPSSGENPTSIPANSRPTAMAGHTATKRDANGKGKEREEASESADGETGVDIQNSIGSPDWPNSDQDDDDEIESGQKELLSGTRREATGATRAMSTAKGTEVESDVWRDPLEDNEDESEPEETGSGAMGRQGKRPRIE
jgi:DNA excision repair protein ERCC-1